jgi:murein DD-endopeptidase MepM/ murein hydrolase activator NlpD
VIRTVASGCVLLAFGGGMTTAPTAPAPAVLPRAAPLVVTYAPPVRGPTRVVRAFEAPSSPYGPGHRGVDLATTAGEMIRAAGDGTVRFAGSVAGRGVVVLEHPDTITTEYEPVRPTVHAGEPVARGQPIARIEGTHGSCAPGGCLHWGAKRGGVYFDPLSLLQPLGPVRLLPWSPAEDP